MNILIACEESQRVCEQFRLKGHNAYSCDILKTSGGHPEWHIKGDVLPLLNGNCSFITSDFKSHTIVGKWDMIIAFPPCTHLAVSGAAWFEKKRKDGRQKDGIDFFYEFVNADCDKVVIENPIGICHQKNVQRCGAKHFQVLQEQWQNNGGNYIKEWIVTIYHDFGPVEIRCESINNALHVIKARREIFPGSIYKLAHKEYKK